MLSALAQRYIAGTTMARALNVARSLSKQKISTSFEILDPLPRNRAGALRNAAHYEQLADAIKRYQLDATFSVKLSRLGLALDHDLCSAQLSRVAKAASSAKTSVTVDMEESRVKDVIMAMTAQAHRTHRNVMITLQIYLPESVLDTCTLVKSGISVRLTKGLFHTREMMLMAHLSVDHRYKQAARQMLRSPQFHAFGTHDEALIDEIKHHASRLGRSPRSFEFQFLYGVRQELAERLAGDGYRVRVLVPYGPAWQEYVAVRDQESRRSLVH